MAKLAGAIMSDPPKYMVSDCPFDFLTEFEMWFWFMEKRYFYNEHWFTGAEIPLDRCHWG